jgi:hypothetical protein
LAGTVLILFSLSLAALVVMARIHHPVHLLAGPMGRFLSNDQWVTIFHGFTSEMVGLVLCLLFGVWLWRLSLRKRGAEIEIAIEPPKPSVVSPPPAFSSPGGHARWKFCNILQADANARRIWQFEAHKGDFVFAREQSQVPGQPLPDGLIGKGWFTLLQPRLNIAWLPVEKVFLRVAQLPKADSAETRAMLEFQLEKLSPLPVTQIVWSFYVLPGTGETQSVVLVIVAREVVEEFLGRLEGERFLADDIEVPLLDQLQPVSAEEEGAWIYPAADKKTALVAWWLGGALQSLSYVYLPAGPEPSGALRDQFAQLLWAGELEGWLKSPLRWHLVAETALASEWLAVFERALEAPVKVTAPSAPSALAGATTRRVAQRDGAANLLPAEFSVRYHQQFVDRLWLQGLGAALVVYFAALVVYFAALTFLTHQVHVAEGGVADMGDSYTNALQLTARYQILKDRQDLKFAALECWRTTAELLPQGATLNALDFRDGAKLSLAGSAPADQVNPIIAFNSALRKALVNGQPLFSRVDSPSYHQSANNTVDWSFECELNRTEETP